MWSILQRKPQRGSLESSSTTMARRLCNIRMENTHLQLQTEAEQDSAMKNPFGKLLTENIVLVLQEKTGIYLFLLLLPVKPRYRSLYTRENLIFLFFFLLKKLDQKILGTRIRWDFPVFFSVSINPWFRNKHTCAVYVSTLSLKMYVQGQDGVHGFNLQLSPASKCTCHPNELFDLLMCF